MLWIWHGDVRGPGDRAHALGTDPDGQRRPSGALRPGFHLAEGGQVAEVVARVAGGARAGDQEFMERGALVDARDADLEHLLAGPHAEPGCRRGRADRGLELLEYGIRIRREACV